jgi:exonuclease SbcD
MDLPIRIVHTADLHLGAPFRSFPEQTGRLSQEQLSMFSRLINFCAVQKPDFLLIAGDLFDQPVPPASLVRTIIELFDTIPETPVFIAAGNHDPACIDSPYRTVLWPKHVHRFTDDLSCVELPEQPIRIHGAGFTASASVASLLPMQPQPLSTDRLNVLVMHADLITRGQSSVYNPILCEQLEAMGFDYAALGHRHERLMPTKIGRSVYAYSGCPMGRGFDETGDKGAWFVKIHSQSETHLTSSRGKTMSIDTKTVTNDGFLKRNNTVSIDAEFISLATRRFIERVVQVDSCTNHDEVVALIRAELADTQGANWQDHLYRVILAGATQNNFAVVPAILQTHLANLAFYAEILDRTEQMLDLNVLEHEDSLRGVFVRLLTEQVRCFELSGQTEQAKMAHLALLLGLEAFNGEVRERAYS